MTPHTDFIRTQGLVKIYGTRKVVDAVDVDVRAGEIVGLLGPNGAGKTTTFYMVVGLIRPTSGHVFLGDEEVTELPMYKRARRGIGYLPQEPSVFQKLTVEENLRAIAETLKLPRAEQERLVEEKLNELNLMHLSDQKAVTLSGGERRRLEIARALICSPRFLLLDEPFSGVDPISVSEVQKIVLSLRDKGIGVLITDHNVRETLKIVDRAYLLHQGKILAEGSSNFLINDEKARQFYLGHDFDM
jgi:lipopolysaccharide export system ATP-binding protein